MAQKTRTTVALFGLPIANVTMAEAVEWIGAAVETGEFHQIATANLDFAHNALTDPKLHRIICDCHMVVPDGAPMLWASRLFGRKLSQRVTGVDMIPEIARLSAERGYGIYMLGSSEENAGRAVEELRALHPGVVIAGRYSPPPMRLEDMDDEEMLERIHSSGAKILLVAFGNPKQEIWIYRNRHRLRVPVCIGIGGSLDMIAGAVRRAPRFVQWLQLEWLFRMLQEPQRLLPRYMKDFMTLVRHLPPALLATSSQPKAAAIWPLEVSVENGARIVRLPEVMTGDDCMTVLQEALTANRERQTLVFDMVLTKRVEADGLGCLLEARRLMVSSWLPVWLAEVSAPVQRVLQSSSLMDLVRVAATVPEAIGRSYVPERRTQFMGYTGKERRGLGRARTATA